MGRGGNEETLAESLLYGRRQWQERKREPDPPCLTGHAVWSIRSDRHAIGMTRRSDGSEVEFWIDPKDDALLHLIERSAEGKLQRQKNMHFPGGLRELKLLEEVCGQLQVIWEGGEPGDYRQALVYGQDGSSSEDQVIGESIFPGRSDDAAFFFDDGDLCWARLKDRRLMLSRPGHAEHGFTVREKNRLIQGRGQDRDKIMVRGDGGWSNLQAFSLRSGKELGFCVCPTDLKRADFARAADDSIIFSYIDSDDRLTISKGNREVLRYEGANAAAVRSEALSPICVDDQGDVYVPWTGKGDDRDKVFAARVGPGDDKSEAICISKRAGRHVHEVTVVPNRRGISAAWVEESEDDREQALRLMSWPGLPVELVRSKVGPDELLWIDSFQRGPGSGAALLWREAKRAGDPETKVMHRRIRKARDQN